MRGEAVVAGWPDVFIRAHLERSLPDSVLPTIASAAVPGGCARAPGQRRM